MMAKTIGRELAVFTLGALLGIAAVHLVFQRAFQAVAWASLAAAHHYQKVNDEDRAILVLAQATGKDPDFYGTYKMLGDIFLKKGNPDLALAMYKRALIVYDREEFLPPGSISEGEKASIRAKIAALEKQMNGQNKGSVHKPMQSGQSGA
jgi:tetratricopeptide (TPR) repeat protein